jgi:hypothetical protein
LTTGGSCTGSADDQGLRSGRWGAIVIHALYKTRPIFKITTSTAAMKGSSAGTGNGQYYPGSVKYVTIRLRPEILKLAMLPLHRQPVSGLLVCGPDTFGMHYWVYSSDQNIFYNNIKLLCYIRRDCKSEYIALWINHCGHNPFQFLKT